MNPSGTNISHMMLVESAGREQTCGRQQADVT